jgi:hypothetical protein
MADPIEVAKDAVERFNAGDWRVIGDLLATKIAT